MKGKISFIENLFFNTTRSVASFAYLCFIRKKLRHKDIQLLKQTALHAMFICLNKNNLNKK